MKTRNAYSREDLTDVFDSAAGQRALAVVTVQSAGSWQSFKARFLEADPKGRFFVLEHEPCDADALPALAPGQYTGVSFRHRSRKVLFATVVEAKGKFMFNDATSVSAVRYRWPDTVLELQRRSYQRTLIPGVVKLLANIWPGSAADRNQVQHGQITVVTGTMMDLSCGGTLVRTGLGTPPAWPADAPLGVELQLPDGRAPVTLDARYRGSRPDEQGRMCIAIQFIGLEVSLDGRLLLQRISKNVQQLSRSERVAGGSMNAPIAEHTGE
ncbi:MAG: PilZ domain-containing protein [Planctomycetia bacterium]|nr:MAG: PilZ domain-containing protein [Planctomycetia bacterium]